MSDPIRVLQVFAALDSGGVSNFVMNLYREIDTNQIQFDFAMTTGEKSLYDEKVLSRGGRIFYFASRMRTMHIQVNPALYRVSLMSAGCRC